MASVRDILELKGTHVESIALGATVFEAAARMNEHKIGALVVCADDRLVGIITERDIMQKVVAQRRDPAVSSVEEVMTSEVVCGRLNTSIEEARGVMANRRIRHMPIVDGDDHLLGLISIGDLNAYHANSQERTIYLLQEYIYGQT